MSIIHQCKIIKQHIATIQTGFIFQHKILIQKFLIPVSFCIYASYSPMVILGQTYLARNLGFSAGITLGVSRSAGGIALPLAGLIADHWSLNAALLCLLVPVAVGIISACMLPKKEPQE